MKKILICALAMAYALCHGETLPSDHPNPFNWGQTAIVLDDFESSGSPATWTAISPSDNPVSLKLAAGSSGQGLALTYRFWRGQWTGSAGLSRSFATPVPAAALAFHVRSQPGVVLHLAVTDDSGQTLEYDLNNLLKPVDANGFSPYVVALDSPARHQGGANDGVFHGAVHALVISAVILNQNGYDTPGELVIDQVAALPTLTYDLNPFAATAVPSPAELGSRPPLFGVNALHWEYNTAELDVYQAAGLSFVRVDVFWDQTEIQAKQYDFSRFNRLIADLKARNMRAMYILLGSNPLYADGWSGEKMHSPQSPASIAAFGDFAAAAAAHFKGTNASFEIWNEPDTIHSWFPGPSAAQYAALARAATARIHAVEPNAPVAVGSTSYVYFFYLDDLMRAGGTQGANALSMHPYRGTDAPETVSDSMTFLRKIRGEALPGSTLPFWQSEWSYTATNLQPGEGIEAGKKRQANFIAREFLTCWALGFDWITWWSASDQGPDPKNWFDNVGLLPYHFEGPVKPSYKAVQTLTKLTRNHTYVGALPTRPTSLHAMKFTGATDTVIALWSDTVGSKVVVTVPAPATAVDCLGGPLALTQVGSRLSLTVSEAAGPVYLTFPAAGDPGGADTAAPTVPTGLAAAAVSSSRIDLTWTASTDNLAVSGYRIFRGGTQVATTAGTTFADSGLSPATAYTYSVVAADAAGNLSARSASASATTLAAASPIAPNQAPVVSTATATPSPVTAKTANLSATATNDDGEASLLYTWTATGPATVTFSPNGSNAAKASVATFSKAGSYTITVTAKDVGNLTSAKSVTVTVQATPTALSISPTGASVQPGLGVDFNALVSDQFNVALSTQPALTWTVSGGGTIATNGLFTAGTGTPSPTGGVAATTYVVTAQAGSVSGTTLVTVSTASTDLANDGGSSGGKRCGGGSVLALIGGLGLLFVRRQPRGRKDATDRRSMGSGER